MTNCRLPKPPFQSNSAGLHVVGVVQEEAKLRLMRAGQAIDYALKRWEALARFVADGSLEIDNNLIEN